jgi:hypothetical protein
MLGGFVYILRTDSVKSCFDCLTDFLDFNNAVLAQSSALRLVQEYLGAVRRLLGFLLRLRIL